MDLSAKAQLKKKGLIKVLDDLPPFYDPERDGVTFSILQAFSNCRQMSRLSLRGWTSRQSGLALTFGTCLHWLLQLVYEDFRFRRLPMKDGAPTVEYVKKRLRELDVLWRQENPVADGQTLQHYELTMLLLDSLMPLYFQHWSRDFSELEWERLEREFKIPFEVQWHDQTFKTFLRGKMDGCFINKKSGHRIWLLETKSKSRVDEGNLVDILPFELQVRIYLVALLLLEGHYPGGVLYNVVRRPGLRQKKKETVQQFANRIVDDIKKRPDWYFIRMQMRVDRADIDQARDEVAELVGEFIAWWRGYAAHWKNSGHCENKYGTCHMLSICSKHNYTSFYKRDRVFRELEEI